MAIPIIKNVRKFHTVQYIGVFVKGLWATQIHSVLPISPPLVDVVTVRVRKKSHRTNPRKRSLTLLSKIAMALKGMAMNIIASIPTQ